MTAEIAPAWGLDVRIAAGHRRPAADDGDGRRDEGEIGFQDYFVGRQHSVPVTALRFDGADDARPAPGVLEAIDDADVVVIAPSNPLVSIGPVLAVPGVRDAVQRRRAVGPSPSRRSSPAPR